MGYEYNPQSQRFDVPNPHRIENLFLAAGAALLIVSGFASLFIARGRLVAPPVNGVHVANGSWAALVVAVLTLFAGFTIVSWILWQLRFYFGREQPNSLAPTMTPTQSGESQEARGLTETMRQNAFNYSVPVTGIDQLLFTWMPDLLFSPKPLQDIARAQFRNLLVLAAILISALISVFGVSAAGQRSLVFMLYAVLAGWVLVRAVLRPGVGSTELSVFSMIALCVVAVIGPVLLGMLLPRDLHAPLGMNWALLASFMVLGALAAAVMLLLAVMTQTLRPTTISMANHLEVVSFNGIPNQILLHYARSLQELWFEKIPNRRYIHHSPSVEGARGAFSGESLEESQPVPTESGPLTLSYCLGSREYRWLIGIVSLALVLIAGTAALSLIAVVNWPSGAANLIAGAAICFLVALYCLRSSQYLWRRFRFTSRLYWLEMQGNFQVSNVDFGNIVQDRFKSQKAVTNVEDMTLREWVADIDSVCYGRDRQRFIVGLAGNPKEAQRLAQHLADFARNQSVIVSPTSARDVERANTIAEMNRSATLTNQGPTPPIVPLPGLGNGGDGNGGSNT
ncbi:MAG: hypothetical protein ABI885_12990 [Gammaproteobacteria bacterium]